MRRRPVGTSNRKRRPSAAGSDLAIEDPRDHPLWWFDNYAGKVRLTVMLPVTPMFESVTEDIARNDATLASLAR